MEKCQAHHLGDELRNEAGAYLVTYSLRMAQGPLVEYLELHPALRTSGVSAGWWALHVAGLQLAWGIPGKALGHLVHARPPGSSF